MNLDSGKGSNVYWNWTIKDKDNKTLSDLSQSMQTSADKMTKMIGNSPSEYEGKMTGIFEIKDEYLRKSSALFSTVYSFSRQLYVLMQK